ncbi:CDP-alcohol phosphatidyltransferase family protein [Mycolicibacterium sp. 120270]|uniref:CDP-alcohol phosphatidyltransferase family protein n=1 Tax=Mycolicibacterium sp. 120270 TaxID=3090600 RepID=UPI00299D48C9|nr:CDP-alcohol phosphatidyltransferase family protein [Mycolicibacterium sp. 120270]MDX1887338.1 CDP-alcohol phosphatidyltransferase family protein [Mycolicibacterium sp. 120270]
MNTDVAVHHPVPTTSRGTRMTGLYALKPWFTGRLTPIINTAVARRVSPDVFTAAGVIAAGAAGTAIAYGWWPLAAVFMVLRLAGANLDGAVARARGMSRPWGFVVNELGDRTSDLLAFAGLAVFAARQHGPGLNWLSWPVLQVLLAALAATLPTFASLAAAAAGLTRRNGGPLGKTERCLFLVLATAFPVIMPILLVQLVNGSLLTTALRLRAAYRELKAHRAQPVAVHDMVIEPTERVALHAQFDAITQPFTAAHQRFNAATQRIDTTTYPCDAPTQRLGAVTVPFNLVTRPMAEVAA